MVFYKLSVRQVQRVGQHAMARRLLRMKWATNDSDGARVDFEEWTRREKMVRYLILNDLRSRVMMTLLIVSMVPLSVAAYQGYHCGKLAVVDLTKLHVSSVIEARHTMISAWVDERKADIRDLAAISGLYEMLETAAPDDAMRESSQAILESIAGEGSPYESIAIFAPDWSPILRIDHGEHNDDEILSDAFKEGIGRSDDIYFDVAHEHETGEIGIHFGSPVRTEGGETIGYLVANLNLSESIAPLLEDRSGLWSTGQAFVISEDLQIISYPGSHTPDRLFQKSANPILLETMGANGQDVRTYRGFAGQEVIGTAIKLPFKNWSAVVEIDLAEAMKWANVLLFRMAITVICALIAILLAGLLLSRAIAEPFVEIANVAHRISEGENHTTIKRSGIREADEVHQAFDRMISELRRNEKSLIHSGKLAAIGELTSSIVHEMRNPLSSIKLNLRALRKDVATDSQMTELMDIAAQQTQRLEQMLAELLQFGKAPELNIRKVALGEIVECCLEVSREIIEDLSAEIEVRDRFETRFIWTDKELVCRILSNLVRNAAEAAGTGARILILAEPTTEDEPGLQLEVHDNGPGVPREQTGRIFAAFHTTKTDGIGLGLTVVKNCVGALGGSIEVTRSPEGGAAFIVRVPSRILESTGLDR